MTNRGKTKQKNQQSECPVVVIVNLLWAYVNFATTFYSFKDVLAVVMFDQGGKDRIACVHIIQDMLSGYQICTD